MTSEHLSSDFPTVAFTLGDNPEALLAASTFPFDFSQIHAIDLVATACPVRFRYTRAPGGFELPLAGLVAISFVQGVITSARVCPHLGSLTEEEAYTIAANVVPRVLAADFRAVAGLGTGLEALPFELNDKERAIDTTILVDKWTYGDDSVLLQVERSGSADLDRKPAPPMHLVRIRIENGPLTRKAIARLSDDGHDVVWKRQPIVEH
jgi:hypothetical protein